jgi:DNA-binding MarR family transcriptional regulator
MAELPGVDPGVEAARLRLQRTARQLERLLSSIASQHGLTLGDWETLSVLRRSGQPYEMAPTTLAHNLSVTSGTISVRLDRLLRAGLVEHTGTASDARSRPVRLTEAGHDRWRRATDARTSMEATLFDEALSQTQVGQLSRLLRKLMVRLERELGPPLHRGGLRS